MEDGRVAEADHHVADVEVAVVVEGVVRKKIRADVPRGDRFARDEGLVLAIGGNADPVHEIVVGSLRPELGFRMTWKILGPAPEMTAVPDIGFRCILAARIPKTRRHIWDAAAISMVKQIATFIRKHALETGVDLFASEMKDPVHGAFDAEDADPGPAPFSTVCGEAGTSVMGMKKVIEDRVRIFAKFFVAGFGAECGKCGRVKPTRLCSPAHVTRPVDRFFF